MLKNIWKAAYLLALKRDSLRQEKRSDKLEIDRQSLLLGKLKRMLFGRKSEKLLRQIEQLELGREKAYINDGERQAVEQPRKPVVPVSRPPRQPLPAHLPRETHVHLPARAQSPDCSSAWKRLAKTSVKHWISCGCASMSCDIHE